MKIGQKLVLGFILVSMLVGVVGYISINTSRKTLQKSIGEETVILAIEVLDGIDRNIYSRIETFQEYSNDLILQEGINESNQIFEKLVDVQAYISEKDQKWVSKAEAKITPFMHDLIYNRVSEELREKIGFYERKYDYKVYGEVFVTNKFGANVGQTGRTSDYYQADEQWWQLAKRDGVYIRDIEYDDSAGVYSTDIGIRVNDKNGNFIGVLKVVLNIEEVISALKNAIATIKYKTAQFKLISNKDKIIYDSEGMYEFLDDISGEKCPKEFTNDAGYCLHKGVVGKSDKLHAYVYSDGYRDFKGLGWVLIVEYDANEIFSPIYRLRNILLIISLVAVTVGVLIGFIFSRSILVPLGKLKKVTIEIGKGNLNSSINIDSKDEIGQLAVSFNQMVEDLKRSNISLQESELRLMEMAENVASVFWMEDTDGNLLYTSPAYERIWGRTCQSFYENPKSWLDAIHPEDRQRVDDSFSKWKLVGEYTEEFRIIRPDGEIRWIYDRGYPIRNKEGEVYRIAGIAEDITKRKQMEEALIQSEKLKSIGTITAGISHEFNNLLTIISGNVQLLERSHKDDEELTEALRTIKRAANDGTEISRKMLKFTYIDKDTAGFVPFDINELINQAIDFTMPRWKNMAQIKGINYQIDKEGMKKVPSILCNPTEIREIFVNIINNALDAMPDGGRISFSTWSEDGTVFISVSDIGEGMSEEVKKNIFDPFFTTKVAVGTGLGMSMAYGIITAHGGKIEVKSAVGSGSTLTLLFPANTKADSPKESPETKQEIESNSLRILVVDDEEKICKLLDYFFSTNGHLVKTVDNGTEAIILAKAADYDLVLCDLAMPTVYGYDVVKALNKLEKRPKIGIITGWGEKLKSLDAEEFKVDFIIKKPFDLSELTKHINDLGI